MPVRIFWNLAAIPGEDAEMPLKARLVDITLAGMPTKKAKPKREKKEPQRLSAADLFERAERLAMLEGTLRGIATEMRKEGTATIDVANWMDKQPIKDLEGFGLAVQRGWAARPRIEL